MVFQKRLDYGFIGYQVPPIPRATRSARRRGSVRKEVDDSQMCAFDLLATVAGKLLLERDSSPSSSNTLLTGKELCNKEQRDEDNLSKVEACHERSFVRNFSMSKPFSGSPGLPDSLKDFPCAHNDDYCWGLASVITSDCSDKTGSAEKLFGINKTQLGSFASKVEVASSGYQESLDCTLEDENKKQIKIEPSKTGNASNGAKADICSVEDLIVRDRKPPALVSVDKCENLPLCINHIPSDSSPACRDDVKLVIRDDDENYSGCSQPRTTTKVLRPSTFSRGRRIRKLLASKYWKVTPNSKHEVRFNAGSEINPAYNKRRICYKQQRYQRDYPIKKRKLFDHSSLSKSGGGISSEGITSLPGKRINCGSGATTHRASGTSTRVAGQCTSFQSRDSHVKLRIKSFKVPELFIEIPESSTVGSLKRTVMDAVTAILGGGLRVGVLLQGKKIRDDSKTLLQTGISDDDKLEALGFSLEPNPSQLPPPPCHEDHQFLLNCDIAQPLTSYPADHPFANLGYCVESDHDSATSPPDMPIVKSSTNSRALVTVPATNVEALAVVPVRKSKRSEAVQRRIRRPFSVSEVESLVQAVEKLGTGRWRDVKLRAFDNARHRTYVDLKDKWKTLVHTARIAPQQRRGEPVPQELLDRVLNAHAYWSQQQAKQQLK